jgi:hypothetical protein
MSEQKIQTARSFNAGRCGFAECTERGVGLAKMSPDAQAEYVLKQFRSKKTIWLELDVLDAKLLRKLLRAASKQSMRHVRIERRLVKAMRAKGWLVKVGGEEYEVR